ncbi:translation initiation factor IF-2 N-terminal domain-containing protein, partial [Pseudonocardia sulfidoxydans]|uniref:translation initiation factor IF-2 N-terminal domain-containing protein n=1 Tax=Pseudonocardia sulfidoxydans TaxID=54011 RepID=UPI0035E5DF1C
MSNNDAPAGSTGGPSVLADLPAKMRVHALAKLIGRTSREVLATLSELGAEVRSPQSSVERALAERVVTALLPDADAEGETAVADDAYEDATTTVAAPALPEIPADDAAVAAAGRP